MATDDRAGIDDAACLREVVDLLMMEGFEDAGERVAKIAVVVERDAAAARVGRAILAKDYELTRNYSPDLYGPGKARWFESYAEGWGVDEKDVRAVIEAADAGSEAPR